MFKTITITFILYFSFTYSSNAQQWKFGVRSSLNYCNNIQKTQGNNTANSYYLYYTKPRLGMNISFATQKMMSEKTGIDFSLGYSLKGGHFNDVLGIGSDRKVGTSHYIQFSPAFLYSPLKNINTTAGFNVGYLLSSDMVGNDSHKKWDISWSIGAEYLIKNIGLSIKYQRSITPFFIQEGSTVYNIPKNSFFNSSIQVGATYYF